MKLYNLTKDLQWVHLPRWKSHGTNTVIEFSTIPAFQGKGFIMSSITVDDIRTEWAGFMACALTAGVVDADIAYLAFTEDDNNPDGIDVILSEYTSVASKARGKLCKFESPYRGITKAEVVKEALKNDVSKELLLKTWSCNGSPEERIHCGECRNCVERKVAFVLNDIEDTFLKDPFDSEYARNVISYNKDGDPYKERLVAAIQKAREKTTRIIYANSR